MLSNDFQKLSVTGLITLYQLDATALGLGILYLHGHTNFEDWVKILSYAGRIDKNVGDDTLAGEQYTLQDVVKHLAYAGRVDNNVGDQEAAGKEYDLEISPTANKGLFADIIFQGINYSPVSITSDGLEMRGDGKASSPTLSIANNIDGVQGAVSAYCLNFSDFAGAKLTVINTLAKYLDSENFALGNSSASDEYKKQVWFIEQKTSENAELVTFELSNPIDFEGQRIPCREINNFCQWAINGGYRGESCGYIGSAMYDKHDNPTTDPSLDRCSGRLQGCKIRFGNDNPLPFGGFPSSSLVDR